MTDGAVTPRSLEDFQAIVADGSFEETLLALEEVVDHLERGRLPLEDAIAWYEIGLKLANRCAEQLQQAELRVTTLEDRYAIAAPGATAWDNDDA